MHVCPEMMCTVLYVWGLPCHHEKAYCISHVQSIEHLKGWK